MKYDEYIKKFPYMKDSVTKCSDCGAISNLCQCGCGMYRCSEYCRG